MSEVSQAIDRYVEEILADAPELSDEQRLRLRELLGPVRRPVLEAAS